MAKTKLTWKRDYGDGMETDDTVLWVNGKPTQTIISPYGGCYVLYINGEEYQLCNTRTEAKETALDIIKENGLYAPSNYKNLMLTIHQGTEQCYLEEHYKEFTKKELKELVKSLFSAVSVLNNELTACQIRSEKLTAVAIASLKFLDI